MANDTPILVFDSGFGGISVMKKLVSRMPGEDYLYFGDSANAPYGPRPETEIRALAVGAIRSLLTDVTPRAVVLACNTVTAVAMENIKQLLPAVPVIGIRPALLQAETAGHRRILSLATAGTLASASYKRQISALSPQTEVVSVAAPGIVTYVESGKADRDTLVSELKKLLLPVCREDVNAVVLGCTHFPFAKDEIREALGRELFFFDAGADVAEATAAALKDGSSEKRSVRGSITFLNSLNRPSAIGLAWSLFESPC